jgi:hypothetical protein
MKTDGCFIMAELTSMSEWPSRRCANLAEGFHEHDVTALEIIEPSGQLARGESPGALRNKS